jgi:protein-tyrosine phosphatase
MPINDPRRVIPLEGIRNFRDLGGYPALDGRVTRWNEVYRADAVSLLTQEGWRAMGDLGIKTVYDLRRQGERDRSPTIDHGLAHEVVHLPVGSEVAEMSLVEWFTTRGPDQPWDDHYIADTYKEILTEWNDVFATLMNGLANPSQRPAVFHCTAGKDRTGLAAALLLDLLGVDRELVLDDYELTNKTRSDHRIAELTPELEAAGIDVELVRPYLSAPRGALEMTLDWLDATYDGSVGYLRDAGVSEDTLESLVSDLLTDDAA